MFFLWVTNTHSSDSKYQQERVPGAFPRAMSSYPSGCKTTPNSNGRDAMLFPQRADYITDKCSAALKSSYFFPQVCCCQGINRLLGQTDAGSAPTGRFFRMLQNYEA